MPQVKKISVATIWGKVKVADLLKAPRQTQTLMMVLGRAVGSKSGTSAQYDSPWTRLLGSFEASNPATGKITQASQLYLPDVAMLPIQMALSESKGVDFAINILATFSEESPTKYTYSWEPLLPPSADDPVSRIRAQLAEMRGASRPEKAGNVAGLSTVEQHPVITQQGGRQ